MPTPDLYDNYGWRGPNNRDVKFEAPEKYLNKNRIKTYADLTKQRAQTLLDSVLKKNQEAEAEEAKQPQEKEQQNSGETEQSRPTVGDTPAGVLDGLIRPLSAQEQANRERAYAARQGVAGLGNGLAALANVLYTGAGATPQQIPDIPDAGGQQLLSWQDRLKQDRYKQADMNLAQLRENRDEEFRQDQLEMARQRATDDKARDERDFNYRKEQDAKKLAFQEQQAALGQQNTEAQLAETKRYHMDSVASKSKTSGSGSNQKWPVLNGYGNTQIEIDPRITNKSYISSIGNRIPESLKKEWGFAKDGVGGYSTTDVIQMAMQQDKSFQEWMISQGYAQISSVQDAPQDNGVLDLGDDEDDDVFDGANFLIHNGK